MKPVTKLVRGGRSDADRQRVDEVRTPRDDHRAPACLGYKTPGWCKGVRS